MGAAPSVPSSNNISLNSNVSCGAKDFQKLWKSLSIGATLNKTLKSGNDAKSIPGLLNAASFKTMAKGTQKGTMKCYFYAQPVCGFVFCFCF